ERQAAPVEARPTAVVAVRSGRSPRSDPAPVTSHESGSDRSGPGTPRHDVTTVETGEHRGGDSSGPGPSEPEPVLDTPTTVVATEPPSSSGPGSGETTGIVGDTSGH